MKYFNVMVFSLLLLSFLGISSVGAEGSRCYRINDGFSVLEEARNETTRISETFLVNLGELQSADCQPLKTLGTPYRAVNITARNGGHGHLAALYSTGMVYRHSAVPEYKDGDHVWLQHREVITYINGDFGYGLVSPTNDRTYGHLTQTRLTFELWNGQLLGLNPDGSYSIYEILNPAAPANERSLVQVDSGQLNFTSSDGYHWVTPHILVFHRNHFSVSVNVVYVP